MNVRLSSEEILGHLLPELPNTPSKAHLPVQESDFHNGAEKGPSTGKHPSRTFHLLTEKFSGFELRWTSIQPKLNYKQKHLGSYKQQTH